MKKAGIVPYGAAIKNIENILDILDQLYPKATCTSLKHKNSFQLLVATILSAQSTDKLVNKVTPGLFAKYKKPKDFMDVELAELEDDIRSTGFFRNKAKSIKACAKAIVEKFNSGVPDNMEDLITLPGVGRKTANVVLANVFGHQAVIVDTHVLRISQRIGLTVNKDATKIEFDLMEILPESKWTLFSHQVIEHGRAVCDAKKPLCSICRILPYCRFGQENT